MMVSNSSTTTAASTSQSATRTSWVLYITLLILRVVVCPFLPGYIHPDEFFQSGQELWYGCASTKDYTTPWEFEPHNALRSVFPPTLLTYLPLQLYTYVMYSWSMMMMMNGSASGGDNNVPQPEFLSGLEILVIPRIMCSILSILTIDTTVWATATRQEISTLNRFSRLQPVPTSVLLLASSWSALGMLSRPFSNTLEACLLAVLLRLTSIIKFRLTSSHTDDNERGDKSKVGSIRGPRTALFVGIGALCSLGMFTRFTFVFFGFPTVVSMLITLFQMDGWKNIRMVLVRIVIMGLSLIAVAISIIAADTRYYSSLVNDEDNDNNNRNDESILSSFVLTPLNALIYNSQISNLKDHGLHPRWTHAAVNMFILFGPLTLVTYYLAVKSQMPTKTTTTTSTTTSSVEGQNRSEIMVCMATVFCGLGFLSLAPHQEPRFLLPLITPLVILGQHSQIFKSRLVIFVWILFNVILFLLFGVLHQGGVTPSLLTIERTKLKSTTGRDENSPQPAALIFFRTYMPPSFLARQRSSLLDETCNSAGNDSSMTCDASLVSYDANEFVNCPVAAQRIIDLNGSSGQRLVDTVHNELRCGHEEDDKTNNEDFVILVVPPLLEELIGGEEKESRDRISFFADTSPIDGGSACVLPGNDLDCHHISSYSPHLTTEDLPPFINGMSFVQYLHQFSLNSYRISCKDSTQN